MTPLGQKLRELRSEQQLSVQDFAARIRKTPGYVSRIETRNEIPSAELLLIIADVLGTNSKELLALAKEAQLGLVAEQIDAKQQNALSLFRKNKK